MYIQFYYALNERIIYAKYYGTLFEDMGRIKKSDKKTALID